MEQDEEPELDEELELDEEPELGSRFGVAGVAVALL
jgi:hypothetical protein